jgi:hypothetical protein
LDGSNDLRWVVFFSESNPFVAASVEGSRAVLTTNLDLSVTVDLNDPEFSVDVWS